MRTMRPEMIPIEINEDESAKVSIYDVPRLESGNYNLTRLNQTVYAIPYNFTLPRLVSVLASSVAVVAAVVIASFYWKTVCGFSLLEYS